MYMSLYGQFVPIAFLVKMFIMFGHKNDPKQGHRHVELSSSFL